MWKSIQPSTRNDFSRFFFGVIKFILFVEYEFQNWRAWNSIYYFDKLEKKNIGTRKKLKCGKVFNSHLETIFQFFSWGKSLFCLWNMSFKRYQARLAIGNFGHEILTTGNFGHDIFGHWCFWPFHFWPLEILATISWPLVFLAIPFLATGDFGHDTLGQWNFGSNLFGYWNVWPKINTLWSFWL